MQAEGRSHLVILQMWNLRPEGEVTSPALQLQPWTLGGAHILTLFYDIHLSLSRPDPGSGLSRGKAELGSDLPRSGEGWAPKCGPGRSRSLSRYFLGKPRHLCRPQGCTEKG